ncbi:MAG: hypothetical protein FWC33_01190 [Candidatus Bathyarchaeota archaeon]|nr:hypothetical protein [Candidatus Termiticorpusculum sp.]
MEIINPTMIEDFETFGCIPLCPSHVYRPCQGYNPCDCVGHVRPVDPICCPRQNECMR